MEKAVQAGDLDQLSGQVAQLRGFTESIEIDTRDAFYRLRDQMREFQHRLREAESLASRDALTGIANRREFDRQLAARIQAQREFCVLLFDMDNLKSINDRFGHLCGDEILKQLSARLSSQVRTRDFVCRWGGDEFAVILDCGLDPGLARSNQIGECLNRPYPASLGGQETMVNAHVSVGIAEHATGETPEQLFRRVDESMYRQKEARSIG
jgi:diguanylate cyclase (GGDEF)-like protein